LGNAEEYEPSTHGTVVVIEPEKCPGIAAL
jgi:hypothetical protein